MIMTLHQDQPAWILKSTQGHNVPDQDKTKCQVNKWLRPHKSGIETGHVYYSTNLQHVCVFAFAKTFTPGRFQSHVRLK